MRLDKLLGQSGYGSRNQVKKLIRSRQVYVDGVLADRDNLNAVSYTHLTLPTNSLV